MQSPFAIMPARMTVHSGHRRGPQTKYRCRFGRLQNLLVFLAVSTGPAHFPIFAAPSPQNAKAPPQEQARAMTTDDDPLKPGAVQPVDSVSFDGAEFIKAFNAASDRTRVVLVFAPS